MRKGYSRRKLGKPQSCLPNEEKMLKIRDLLLFGALLLFQTCNDVDLPHRATFFPVCSALSTKKMWKICYWNYISLKMEPFCCMMRKHILHQEIVLGISEVKRSRVWVKHVIFKSQWMEKWLKICFSNPFILPVPCCCVIKTMFFHSVQFEASWIVGR